MKRASAIYEGAVRHRRLDDTRHAFRHRLFLLYVDLDELPGLFRRRWFWSARRPNLAWFRRADYLGPADRPLDEAVRDRVEAELGRRPAGPVRVLTQLRTLGYVFNPVSFYYCHDSGGELDAIVAEITNTPWGERHAYVLDARDGEPHGGLPPQVAGEHDEEGEARDADRGRRLRWRFAKDFHVSPFQRMEQLYEWSFGLPGERLDVGMTSFEGGRPVFTAGLACRRRAITAAGLAGVLVRHPLLTFRVHAAIYWQAARLFLKRAPFFVHPGKRKPAAGSGGAPASRGLR